jgi:predicted AAA+ superfamily ATPase
MKRELYKGLLKWKNGKNRKPLVLQGARQVGKTYLVKQFAQQEYDQFIHLNFEKNPELKEVFNKNLVPQTIINELGFLFGKKIKQESTLIFFDEIQASEQALKSLKYFHEDAPEYHIIAAGSLLGVAVNKERSFPVGKVTFLEMYPLSFSEYLIAFGDEMLQERIANMKKADELPEIIHNKLLNHFKLYLFLGGMPEVLQNYLNNNNIASARRIQNDIIKAFENDFSKYTTRPQTIKNMEVWNSIPTQLAKENKKFKYSAVKNKARASNYELAIDWLKRTGLVNISYNIATAKLPLAGYTKESKFKLFLLDTGLLGAMLKLGSDIIIKPQQLFKEYNGAFIENFVAMELSKVNDRKLFYWTSRGEAEVDFIIQQNNEIYPLEVKSGTSKNLKSLRSYEQKYQPKYIIRTSPRNYFQQDEFINIPLYAVSSVYNFI